MRRTQKMKKNALAYHGAVPMIVCGLGDKDIREVRIILAANGYFTLNMRDIADMGVVPLGRKKFHPDDWKFNDGKSKTKTKHWLTVWIHTSKAALRNHNITMDPLVAWNQIKDCADTVKFLGGERAKPGKHHGDLTFALGRAPVGADGWDPSYPAAFLLPTLGIVPGAQQSMEIANMMQDEVLRIMNADDPERGDAEAEEADKYDQTMVGVFYHAWFTRGRGRHVYMIHAQNPMAQEAVSDILAGSVMPLIARDVYYAASELQLLENSIRRFKDKMKALLQAGMNTEQRRVASRAIWEDTKELAKKDLDTELLKEMGLKDWAQATEARHSPSSWRSILI
jgi:hypothetical protein